MEGSKKAEKLRAHIMYSLLAKFYEQTSAKSKATSKRSVVRPYHVAPKFEYIFIKKDNGANILSVYFC